jgi:hypothetical protein
MFCLFDILQLAPLGSRTAFRFRNKLKVHNWGDWAP